MMTHRCPSQTLSFKSATLDEWEYPLLHSSSPRPPKLPLPAFPRALDFDVDVFLSSFDRLCVLEKAIIHHVPSQISFGNDPPMFRATATRTGLPLSSDDEAESLPPKKHTRLLRHLRYTIFTVYRRMFSFVYIANLIGFLILIRIQDTQKINLDILAGWASTNFVISILIRQDFCVNFIFRTAWLVPWSIPLRVRRFMALVYAYGGIHSGTAVAGTMWFLTYTCLLTMRFAQEKIYSIPILVLSWIILVLLSIIIILAFPQLRSRHHNTFEMTHRFLGWITILLFWAQLILFTCYTSLQRPSQTKDPTKLLLHSPTFYNLILITAMFLYPWLRLRKWTFIPEKLSSHAIRLHLTEPVHRFSCLSISTSPLKEWHPFATFPSSSSSSQSSSSSSSTGTPSKEMNTSLIISAAGDWTTTLIANTPSNPTPLKFYIRPPKPGVLSLTTLFRRAILLTTGSGIGPSMSSLIDRHRYQSPTQFIRLIWVARSPLLTFGQDIVDEVHCADPRARIIDTAEMGDVARGELDLVAECWRAYREADAEAVFVLSNKVLTKKVVYGLESRGILAFGPIWDS